MRRSAQFEYRDEFADFLPNNGVRHSAQNCLTWMNRASKLLGRKLGPGHLSCEADVQRLLSELNLAEHRKYSWATTEYHYEKNLQSTFRKYVQMIQSNFRGMFAHAPAALTPVANDVPDGLPEKVKRTIHRFVRDTKTSREIKWLYEFQCQVCKTRLEIKPGVFYAEGHHIRPLGGEHKGKDVRENILCLCPNHHALFDYFAIPLDPKSLQLNKHPLGQSYIDYHNAQATRERISVHEV